MLIGGSDKKEHDDDVEEKSPLIKPFFYGDLTITENKSVPDGQSAAPVDEYIENRNLGGITLKSAIWWTCFFINFDFIW